MHRNALLTNVSRLYEYIQTVPLSSVECERSFSKMNLIKSALRNSLETDTLGDLMNISINGPDFKEFPYEEAFKVWQEKKERRFI